MACRFDWLANKILKPTLLPPQFFVQRDLISHLPLSARWHNLRTLGISTMEVIEDKVTVYPPHSICKADVPVILSALPAEWTAGIQTVRLSAAMNENPTVIASFHPSYGSLLVKSRGFSKERVLRGILTELAGHALGVAFRSYGRLQKRDESRIQAAIAPLAEGILPQLSQKKVWLDK